MTYLQSIKNDIVYSNLSLFDPNGVFLAYVPEKKFNWYITRNLAVKISETEAKLTFMPKGQGYLTLDPYYKEGQINRCVICGETTNLTRHHVVPYQYRKHFPEEYKNHTSFDVLCVCIRCHENYEDKANKFKNLFEKEKIVDRNYDKEKREFLKINSLIKTLKTRINSLPDRRIVDILKYLSNYLKKEITKEDINGLEYLKWEKLDEIENSNSKVIADSYIENGNVFEFILLWREHFLKHAKPKFLSEKWLNAYKTLHR